jgi:hypothetical protein
VLWLFVPINRDCTYQQNVCCSHFFSVEINYYGFFCALEPVVLETNMGFREPHLDNAADDELHIISVFRIVLWRRNFR